MFRAFSMLVATASLLAAQLPQAPTAPAVAVPTFPNSTCPIMGKKVSLPLFTDTEHGRIYVCCKPCIRKIHANVATAYSTAYPTTKDLVNAVCPVSGEPIGEHRVTIELQGVRIALCCEGCIETARKQTQVTLARAHNAKLVDVGNNHCPVDGLPAQPNAFVLIGDAIVRLSSPQHQAEVAKAPQVLLDKARAIRAKEPKQPPHEHRPARDKRKS